MSPYVRSAVALALTVWLSACATPGEPTPALPMLQAQQLAASQTLATEKTQTPVVSGWWRAYGDPQLQTLVGEALAGNPSLAEAAARVRQADAVAEVAGATRYPNAGFSAEIPRERQSENGMIPPAYAGKWDWQPSTSVNLSYDLDFWGKHKAETSSALVNAQVARLEAEDARQAIATAVVVAYVNFDRVHGQREFAERLAQSRGKQLELTRQRVKAGLDTDVELHQAESALAQARAELVSWREQVKLAGYQLAELVGAGPDRALSLTRPQLGEPRFGLPRTLPAELLGQRPDIAAARARVEAAEQDIEVARDAFYPNINLSAFVGLSSLGLSHWLEASSTNAGIVPSVSLPIFDGGRLRGQLHGREAARDALVAAYNASLIQALHDVAVPVAALASVDGQRPELDKAVAAAAAALDLARLRYEHGLGNYLTVLSAEAQWIAISRSRLDLDAKAGQASAELARAVGGGWQPQARPPVQAISAL